MSTARELDRERAYLAHLYEVIDEQRRRSTATLAQVLLDRQTGRQATFERDRLSESISTRLERLGTQLDGLCFGKLVATGGYDQKIKLWEIESGREVKSLDGHNGPVFDLAFRPDGKILASVSGDRTVKLWDVATGARLDTLVEGPVTIYAQLKAEGQDISEDGSTVVPRSRTVSNDCSKSALLGAFQSQTIAGITAFSNCR